MTKIFCAALAALLLVMPAAAQNSDSTKTEKKPKKEGGFMKFLKKGIESTTGLDVSKEILFVYPTLMDWKMQFVSCKGNKETGEVVVVINVMNLGKDNHQTEWCDIKEAKNDVGQKLEIKYYNMRRVFNLKPNVYVEVAFYEIVDVPLTSKTVNGKFMIGASYTLDTTFEFRDAPITWE